MQDNVIALPEAAPRYLCTVSVSQTINGEIRARLDEMSGPIIDATGNEVADRVAIIAGWLRQAADDMDRQAREWGGDNEPA